MPSHRTWSHTTWACALARLLSCSSFLRRRPCSHLQAVHLPLAIHYARRLDGAALGSALDEAFACMWLFVVCARGALMTGVAYRLVSTQGDARYVQPPLALLMVALDTVWTRETFERRKVSPTGLAAAAVGLPVGLTSDGESRSPAPGTALCALHRGVGAGGSASWQRMAARHGQRATLSKPAAGPSCRSGMEND